MGNRNALLLVVLLALSFAGWNSVHAMDSTPLAVGNRWVYSPSHGDGVRVDQIIGTEMIDGILTYVWKREEAAPDNYHEKMWIARDGSGLKMARFWSNMGPDPAVSLDWVLMAPSEIALGESHEYEMSLGGARVKITSEIESLNNAVITPAGFFDNCAVVKSVTEVTKNNETDYHYEKDWSCPGVGVVIMNNYTENWESLEFSQKLREFSNAGDFHVDINTNKDVYNSGDSLQASIGIYNSGTCQMADIYLVFQNPDGALSFFPDFSASPRTVLSDPIEICGSPFISDLIFYETAFSPIDRKGTRAIHGILTKPGSDPLDVSNWLSLDSAPYNLE
ncbi:MAG: hypothetical protein GY859_34820 [Desulfobacterales bacterium]|nr:hypothetical protein [Desulfobacterales bacterium]